METIGNSNIEIIDNDRFYKKHNNLHVSVITPVTKKIIHCTDTKVTAFYKPIDLVEKINYYVNEGDKDLIPMYKDLKETKLIESKKEENLLKLAKSKFGKTRNGKPFFHKLNNKGNNKKEKDCNSLINNKIENHGKKVQDIETLFIPKFEKNVEIISQVNEHINIDFTYMIPKPIIIPVEVPVLKFKDNFQIIPIKKKILPIIKYTDEIIYVDCYIEKPYLVLENVILPIPCNVPIKENKYIDKVPPINNENNI